MTDYDKRVNDEADEHAQMINKSRPLEILEHIALKKGKPLSKFVGFRTTEYTTSHSEQFNED